MIRLENISKRVGEFQLKAINLEVAKGGYTVLLGDSGSGKSLLLDILAGIRNPDSGKLFVRGEEVQDRRIQDRPFGIVFQDLALFPHMTVGENISFPLKVRHWSRADMDRKVAELAGKLGIEHLVGRFPGVLSGGEKQRVALARTLATRPECLLLDEPLTALDARIRKEIKSILRRLNREGQTIIHVTHDYHEALALATHIGILENGSLIQHGPAEEVLRNPVNTFTASFTGIRNFIRVTLTKNPDTGLTRALTDQGISITMESAASSGWGYVIIPEEAIFLARQPVYTSAANNYPGTITDLLPVKHGVEVAIDAGFPLYALLTHDGVQRLGLTIGDRVYASFKATAVRFIRK